MKAVCCFLRQTYPSEAGTLAASPFQGHGLYVGMHRRLTTRSRENPLCSSTTLQDRLTMKRDKAGMQGKEVEQRWQVEACPTPRLQCISSSIDLWVATPNGTRSGPQTLKAEHRQQLTGKTSSERQQGNKSRTEAPLPAGYEFLRHGEATSHNFSAKTIGEWVCTFVDMCTLGASDQPRLAGPHDPSGGRSGTATRACFGKAPAKPTGRGACGSVSYHEGRVAAYEGARNSSDGFSPVDCGTCGQG